MYILVLVCILLIININVHYFHYFKIFLVKQQKLSLKQDLIKKSQITKDLKQYVANLFKSIVTLLIKYAWLEVEFLSRFLGSFNTTQV